MHAYGHHDAREGREEHSVCRYGGDERVRRLSGPRRALQSHSERKNERRATYVEYLPRIDEDPDRGDDERAAADIEEAWEQRGEVDSADNPACDDVHGELREEEREGGEEDRSSCTGPAVRLDSLEEVV